MTDIMAAIGLRQLDRYLGLLDRRVQMMKNYDAVCDELGIDHMIHHVDGMDSSNHLYLILDICKKEKIQILISIVTRELEIFAKEKSRFLAIGTLISTMDYGPLHIANNKGLLLQAMKEGGIPTPDFYIANTPEKEFQLKMIAPGDRDYLFEVVDHGFLLRFVLKDKKGIIVVGDSKEQIDEKLKDL